MAVPVQGDTDPGEQALALRRRILKLRWMGFEGEADWIAAEIAGLERDRAPKIPRVPAATD